MLLLRRKSFLDVLQGIGEGEAVRPVSDAGLDERLRDIVAASMAVSLIFRSKDRCLVRALAVYRACRRSGIHPKLVFGVRMNPFTAHCLDMRRRL